SIPGGGGEILVQEVRDRVARKKAGADRWLEVMETAHGLGLKTSVTMMYGLGESLADRIEHLFRVMEVQARAGGCKAVLCWRRMPRPEMRRLIGDARYVPRQRRQDYSVIDEAA